MLAELEHAARQPTGAMTPAEVASTMSTYGLASAEALAHTLNVEVRFARWWVQHGCNGSMARFLRDPSYWAFHFKRLRCTEKREALLAKHRCMFPDWEKIHAR